MTLVEIATRIAGISGLLLVQGVPTVQQVQTGYGGVFIGKQPISPDRCVTLYEVPGLPSDLGFGVQGVQYEYPHLQIRSRDTTHLAARTTAESIYRDLPKIQAQLLSGTNYQIVRCITTPWIFGEDNAKRPMYVFTIQCDKSPS